MKERDNAISSPVTESLIDSQLASWLAHFPLPPSLFSNEPFAVKKKDLSKAQEKGGGRESEEENKKLGWPLAKKEKQGGHG